MTASADTSQVGMLLHKLHLSLNHLFPFAVVWRALPGADHRIGTDTDTIEAVVTREAHHWQMERVLYTGLKTKTRNLLTRQNPLFHRAYASPA